MKTKKWTVNVDGIDNEIVFVPNIWTGKHELTVNGNEIELKRAAFQAFVGWDQPFSIAGKECRAVIIGNKADIAVDGVYLDSKKEYKPLKKMAWWTWIFIIAFIAIPIVSLGGIVPTLLALCGSIWCARISTSPNMNTAVKILLCLGILAVSVALLVALRYLMALI